MNSQTSHWVLLKSTGIKTKFAVDEFQMKKNSIELMLSQNIW